MTAQDLLTPYPRKAQIFTLLPRSVALATFSMRRYIRIMVLICVAFFACDASAEDIQNLSVPIIVQFTNAGITPASPGFVGDLSREVGVTLTYSKPASEDSHAFLVSGLFADFPLSDMLQRLQRRADVISVTEDITGELATLLISSSSFLRRLRTPAILLSRGRFPGMWV